ncbi:hypothetical protein ACHAXR_004936 [Thalassiosira sp. AJA248-18]
MLTVKLLLNSIVSTPGAKFFNMDIKNFYLMTPLKRREYVRLNMSDMPDNVIEHYQLKDKATPDGSIFASTKRRKAEYWPRNSSRSSWGSVAITRANIHHDCGFMRLVPSPLHNALMISESST